MKEQSKKGCTVGEKQGVVRVKGWVVVTVTTGRESPGTVSKVVKQVNGASVEC